MSETTTSSPEYKVASGRPNTCGYLVILLQVDPDTVATDLKGASKASIAMGASSPSPTRTETNRELDSHLSTLRTQKGVITASLFEAFYFDHGTLDRSSPFGRQGARIAHYDTVLIVKTEAPEQAGQVMSGQVFEGLLTAIRSKAKVVEVLVAKNIKKPGDVDRSREGCFLINFFFAEDVAPLVDVWDSTAGWWQDEGKMANSELLQPLADSGSDYAIINTARWDNVAPALAAFGAPTYGEYVLAHINENRATTMPGLYRLVA